MSSDGERIHKTSKSRKLIIYDSDSSEGSIIVRNNRKRKPHQRVVSDAENSDDDGDVPRPVNKRKVHRLVSESEVSCGSSDTEFTGSNLIESDDSEWQSDWDSVDDSDNNDEPSSNNPSSRDEKKTKKTNDAENESTSGAGFDSDNSDGQSDKCPICLLPFRKQEIATPSSCEHCFCLECILEWSKNINTCPVDRQTFTIINVKSHTGKVLRYIPVEVKQQIEDTFQEDPTYCEICGECDREDRMLLCDGCDLGYHMECLQPQLFQVPLDEWYCSECSQNMQNDAEAIDIDLDEVPDLIEEARRLGLSYGRTRGRHQIQNTFSPRIIPRTRQTERVRANIRAGRNLNLSRARETRERRRLLFDPDQPSTSSGIDSIGENSRSRSPDINAPSTSSGRTRITRRAPTKKSKTKTSKTKKRNDTILRKVRITEINDDGEEEEIISYVKVKASTTTGGTSRKRKYKRLKRRGRRNKRRARTVLSVVNAKRQNRGMPLLKAKINRNGPEINETGSRISSQRYRAGIPQLNVLGSVLSLDSLLSPGSEDENDSTSGHGPAIVARSRGHISTVRRRMALKGIANPTVNMEDTSGPNLLDSILKSQEIWHNQKSHKITLKSNGSLLVTNKDGENTNGVNNNESPIKKKNSNTPDKLLGKDQPLDLSNVNPNDITQAPMYNSPRGGGGGNRGNFRGGYRENNRQSHGGQGYGGRDSYSGGGRRSYGGPGMRDDFGNRGPPENFNTNFQVRPPGPFGTPPFRNRNPQHFRNERNRYSMPERLPFPEGNERPPFPFQDNFNRGPPPLIRPLIPPGPPGPPSLLRMPIPTNNVPPPVNDEELPENTTSQQTDLEPILPSESESQPNKANEEELDIYSDMVGPSKHVESESQSQDDANNSSSALLPPPEPPSGLLDFDENSKSEKDNDSDQELIIDDTPKDDAAKNEKTDDIYDPFNAEESDSNDSNKRPTNIDIDQIPSPKDPPPLEPPPSLESFTGLNILNDEFAVPIKSTIRLTAYDDDEEDDDSQADCPNFSIYSSETMDVARHTEQELSSQIGPLEPPPLPPEMPDLPEDEDVILGDVQTCDLPDIPEPPTPYIEALRKERQTISKIPPKKISSNDSRGKITFKINTLKLNNKFGNLYDEMDREIESSIDQEKVNEEKKKSEEKDDADYKEKKKKKKRKRKDSSSMDLDSSDSKDSEKHKMEVSDDDNDNDASELPTQKIHTNDTDTEICDSQLPTQKYSKTPERDISEFETQKLDTDLQTQNIALPEENSPDISELQTQKLDLISHSSKDDISDLPTQILNEEMDLPAADSSELPTQILDNVDNRSDHPESEHLESYSPKGGMMSLYSPDVPVPVLYSPKPDDESDRRTPELRNRGQLKGDSDSEGGRTPERKEISKRDQEIPDGEMVSRKDDDDKMDIARSPDTVISIADTIQSSQNDDCEIVEQRTDPITNERSPEKDEIELPLDKLPTDDDFPLEKEGVSQGDVQEQEMWDSDGGYTPCKDELPLKEKTKSVSPFDQSGLEPITPTRDKNDDLDRCRTPPAYAGLGTEAISETDEAMNFEDELTLLSLRKEKEMEEGEIPEEGRLARKDRAKDNDDDNKRKKKKDKKDRSKETEKNKENISSENFSWKKMAKSTKDRNYREKDRRSRSREKDKEKDKRKKKEAVKKKEKRKELPRYDVRKIVSEKPRSRKDEYGRDIRDLSHSLTRSKSRSRSHSRVRRSLSKGRRSLSKVRRSRSYSRLRSKSRSRSKRRSWSRDRDAARVSRGRSYSRGRSLSPRRRKSPRRSSISRKRKSRSLSRRRRRRSLTPRGRDRRKRSPSRKRRSRTRSKSLDARKDKKKHKSRSRSRLRKRSRTRSGKRNSKSRDKKHTNRKPVSRSRSRSRSLARSLSQQRDRNRNWEMSEKIINREPHFRQREDRESWSAQWTPSLSASRSKTPERVNDLAGRGWTPPHGLDNVTVPPKNLTVILTNKEAIKKKKKEKKKERRKSKDIEKRKKGKRMRTPPPSKEVFASGDNILVSVCFNKDNEGNQINQTEELPETIPLMPPTKRRRREPLQIEPAKKTKKDKVKEKRAKSPKAKKDKKKKSKAAEIAATKKPVAVIDLDQSPFREQTPSPRDVIVLSDDDEKQAQNLIALENQSSQVTPSRDFVSQGPKTPPEPQVKFSINKQANSLRPSMMNPLMEEEEEEEEEEIDERVDEELELRAQEELELRLKIGPNTPPEPPSSPPTSPDAYDPFDPTKSRSPTPVQSQEATPLNDERIQRTSPRKHDSNDTPLTSSETQDQEKQVTDKQTEKPKIISMVTIKRASPKRDTSPANDTQTDNVSVSESPTKSQQSLQNAQSTVTPFPTINPVLATVAAAVQRSNIFNTNAPATTQRNLAQTNRISPSNQIKQRPLERPQLPNLFTNSVKTTANRASKPTNKTNALGQNGNDTEMANDVIDMSSPYSPGSSISDGMFDPPSPYNTPPPEKTKSKVNKDPKKDAFDVLFGASPVNARNATKVKVKKDKRKKSVYPLTIGTNPKVGVRMDENQLQILDDLPSSAVEMQVKDKFLKKLNRQERVVEEVKLVLKPHYTKKHVTKEEYKDIMRKAVPKICHNRSGEINPKKIAALIEAYVKKCRGNKKRSTLTATTKVTKTIKNLWS